MIGQSNDFEKMKSLEIKLPARVYYVSSPDDNTVLLALDVNILSDAIHWFDTVKERVVHMAQVQAEYPAEFTFKTPDQEGGRTYTFTPLTLEVYNNKVKSEVLVPQEFSSEEEMLSAFEKTHENVW
jgi:hypothetical protein